jgi:hypothetical protein
MVSDGMVKLIASCCARLCFSGRMVRNLQVVLAVGFVLVAGCSPPREEAADLIILHSGRMRGNVYPLSLQSIAPLQHYQYLAGYIRKVRAEATATGANVFLVDLGDSLTGSFAAHVTQSENMVTFFNDTAYDAVVLSNLDDAVQPETLSRLKAQVLNPFQNSARQPATEGTVFGAKITVAEIPVFLISNFYGDTESRDVPDRFPTRFEAVMNSLNRQPGEGIAVLSWMKFESPKEAPKPFLQSLRRLGIDAILAHRIYGGKERAVWATGGSLDWKPPVSLNILRNNGGFALARLDLKRDGDHWRVLRHELVPMTANTAASDFTIVEAIARFALPITRADTELAELATPVSSDGILAITMTALTSEPGTQAVLYSPQSIRSSWISGPLRASQVFNTLPWTTPIVQLTLTPEQLATARKDLNLTLWKSDSASSPKLTVTTSWYFGHLIETRLGLPPETLRETDQKSEFDAFVAYLKAHPTAVGITGPPAGWTDSVEP